MAIYKSKIITKKGLWEKFLISKNPKSFLQSWHWGRVNELQGAKIFRLGFFKSAELIGICLLIKERARRGHHLLVPGGPIIDWSDRKAVDIFIKSARDLAISEGCWFVRLRPEILDTINHKALFNKLHLIPAPMHLHAENTWVLDISKPEEEILSGMRKTTRYLVRKGEKSGLSVEISINPATASTLYSLQTETIKRHGFVGFPEELFKNEIEIFGKDGIARVFLCKKGKQVLAVAIIIFYADTAYYHFSGSVSGYKEIPFSYYLQWQIIKMAKEYGIKNYNFWGIAPNDNPNHRFAGVTVFKKGFGGDRVDWLHAHDLVVSNKYWITYTIETMRRIFRRL